MSVQKYPFVYLFFVEALVIVACCQEPRLLARMSKTDVSWADSVCWVQARLTTPIEPYGKTLRADAEVSHIVDTATNAVAATERGSVRLSFANSAEAQNLQEGDILILPLRKSRESVVRQLSSAFDYQRWLLSQGIVRHCYVDSVSWRQVGHEQRWSLMAMSQKCRERLLNVLRKSGLSEQNYAVVAALTLGYRESLDADTKRAFSAAGAMHILAVSGLHVGIIYGLLLFLLTIGKRRNPLYNQKRRYLNAVVIIAALWFYAFLTGMTPSVMRAALMLTLAEVGRCFYRQYSSFNIIAASAFICLLIRPLSLFSVSFQLSYSAVLGIVTVGSWMQRVMNINAWLKQGVWKKIAAYVVGIVIMSVAAQMFTLPLSLHYFSQTSNYFILTNLIVIPAASIIVYSAILLFIFSPVPSLFRWIGVLVNCETSCLNRYVTWIEGLLCSTTHLTLSTPETWLMYAAIVAMVVAVRYKRLWVTSITGVALVVAVVVHSRLAREMKGRDIIVVENGLYHISGHAVDTISADTTLSFVFHEKRWLYIGDETFYMRKAECPLKVDYLIVDRIGRTIAEDVLANVQADTIVLSSQLSRWKTEKIVEKVGGLTPIIDAHGVAFVRKYY